MEEDLLNGVVSYGPHRFARKLLKHVNITSYNDTILSLSEHFTSHKDPMQYAAYKDFFKNHKHLKYLYHKLNILG